MHAVTGARKFRSQTRMSMESDRNDPTLSLEKKAKARIISTSITCRLTQLQLCQLQNELGVFLRLDFVHVLHGNGPTFVGMIVSDPVAADNKRIVSQNLRSDGP